MLVLDDRYRILDEVGVEDAASLARCHDVDRWADCAIFVVHVRDPREWSIAVDHLQSTPTVIDTGRVAFSEMGWVVLDTVIGRVVTTDSTSFFADPGACLVDLLARARSDA